MRGTPRKRLYAVNMKFTRGFKGNVAKVSRVGSTWCLTARNIFVKWDEKLVSTLDWITKSLVQKTKADNLSYNYLGSPCKLPLLKCKCV